jgi:hypothetical protein
MPSRLRGFFFLGALALAASGLAVSACSSSNGNPFTSDDDGGGAEASHGGHDAAGGNDSTAGGETGTDGGAGGDASSGNDTGSAKDTGAGNGDGGGTTEGGDGGASADAADGGVDAADANVPECGAIPTLHPDDAGTIYCGFTDGGSLLCPTGQECCLGGSLGAGQFAPEVCASYGATCTNGGVDGGSPAVPITCAQVADCRANGNAGATSCCLQGATVSTVPGCGYPKFSHGSAIVCEGDAGGPATPCGPGETQICSSQADCPSGTTCTAGKWKIYQLGFCL